MQTHCSWRLTFPVAQDIDKLEQNSRNSKKHQSLHQPGNHSTEETYDRKPTRFLAVNSYKAAVHSETIRSEDHRSEMLSHFCLPSNSNESWLLFTALHENIYFKDTAIHLKT